MKKDKRKITVWKNGQQVKLSMYSSKNNDTTGETENEEAATLTDTEEEVPSYARLSDKKFSVYPIFFKKIKHMKPLIIAIASAFIIGTLLGITLIRMFVTIDEDRQANSEENNASVTETSREQERKELDGHANIKGFDIFVLQGGVFSEAGNAQTWQKKFQEEGLPAMIWEKDKQYFLLISAAASKEKAERLKNDITSELDIYVKKWQIHVGEEGLKKEERSWMQTFADVWRKDMQQQKVSKEQWESTKKTIPKRLQSLGNAMNQHVIEEKNDRAVDLGANLLTLWYELIHELNREKK
ncbi:hypothetical protein [Virgibacillus dokdonensis]